MIGRIFQLLAITIICFTGAPALASDPRFDFVDAVYESESIFGGEVKKITKEKDSPNFLMQMYIEKFAKGPPIGCAMPIRLNPDKISEMPKLGDKKFVFIAIAVPVGRAFDLYDNVATIDYTDQNFKLITTIQNPEKIYLESEAVLVCHIRHSNDGSVRFGAERFFKGPPNGVYFQIDQTITNPGNADKCILFIKDAVPVNRKFPVLAAVPYSDKFIDSILAVMEKHKSDPR